MWQIRCLNDYNRWVRFMVKKSYLKKVFPGFYLYYMSCIIAVNMCNRD